MKKLIAIALLVAMLVGCTTQTDFGPCVGIGDENKNPNLIYKLSVWNLVLAIVFVETIVVPVTVAVDSTYCPIDKK